MNLFEIVKYGVSCREAAERYGVEVNRYSMALCPFHNDPLMGLRPGGSPLTSSGLSSTVT